ncbi:MAG: serine/threonine transporter SstT [Cardiobacteriaceae bacterium]|nr:serine/threonine transporter SstT [Cardiobacteriaceae bacterium]
MLKNLFDTWCKTNLMLQIIIGIFCGIALGILLPEAGESVAFLGEFFVKALKSVAPVLVFILVLSAIAQHRSDRPTNIRGILILYLIGTFAAALCAVSACFLLKPTLLLTNIDAYDASSAPNGVLPVLKNLLMNLADNPFNAIANANYIGILAWATIVGFAMKQASDHSKVFLAELSDAVAFMVRIVIRLAPFGVFGLVAQTLSQTSFSEFASKYAILLMALVGAMLFVALVLNPLIVFVKIRRNPYPLVFTCLAESGLTAFFTRSSAANIPVNMDLCKKLNLNPDTYSVSIPLGATINMAGAAVTVTVMALAAANTLNMHIGFMESLLLSVVASLCACGASGVAGGSLLLIPLACSLFGIDNAIAAQVIGIGMIIGVIQDSAETALNSSTDVLFTAAAEMGATKNQA